MVSITVLSVTPTRAGKLLALASVELVIDGVPLTIHGIQALRVEPIGTKIELPKFRASTGEWQTAISLPDDLHGRPDRRYRARRPGRARPGSRANRVKRGGGLKGAARRLVMR